MRSVKALLEGKLQRLKASTGPTSEAMVAAVKRSLDVENTLGQVREPIKRRADTEQRNSQWLATETSKAFGGKLRELARVRLDIEKTKGALLASKPELPPMDKSDFLGAMETIAIAQRVAMSTEYHKLSPAEKLAAVRAPALSKIPDSVAASWTAELTSAAHPERAAVYKRDLEIVEEAEQAIDIVMHSLKNESGHIDRDTGLPSPSWPTFEREHLAPIKAELDAAKKEDEAKRVVDAVTAAKEALRKAEYEQSRLDIKLLKDWGRQ